MRNTVNNADIKTMEALREQGMTNEEVSQRLKIELARVNDFLRNGPELADEPDEEDETSGGDEASEDDEEVTGDADE